MKTWLLIAAAIGSVNAFALSDSNKIIDPPRRPVHIGIVTPNEGPTDSTTPPTGPGEWFPVMQINADAKGVSTFEDSIIRKVNAEAASTTEQNFLDSDAFDPASPQAEQILNIMDQIYESETGLSAYPTGATVDRGDIDPALLGQGTAFEGLLHQTAGCVRQSCAVWAVVSKASQTITIYVNGSPIGLSNNRTSTGTAGHGTPNFDKHPDGRIYQRYSSKKFPGGDYNGLGNMPYAVFIRGGFAIHGTPTGNWSKLGRPASHGCIRVHPSTGQLFNSLVRKYGVSNTWITVR